MRKILAGFMATAMVTSICATASMAATNQAASINFGTIADEVFDIDDTSADLNVAVEYLLADGSTHSPAATTSFEVGGNAISTAEDVPYTATFTPAAFAELTLTDKNSKAVTATFPVSLEKITGTEDITVTDGVTGTNGSVEFAASDATLKKENVAKALNGQKFSNLLINGKYYSGTILVDSKTYAMEVKFNEASELTGVSASASLTIDFATEFKESKAITFTDSSPAGTAGTVKFKNENPTVTLTYAGTVSLGQGGETADITSTNINIADAVVCDGEGNPIPLVDGTTGVDKELNDDDGVQAGTTVYFMVKDTKADGTKSYYNDEKYYKLRIKKGENAKQVKAVSEVYKNFSSNLRNAVTNEAIPSTSGRNRFIKVELQENYTGDEYKIGLDLSLTPTQSAVDKEYAKSADELKVKDFSFYMKNIERTADNDWRVGINGLMLKPMENDWNDVVWYDEDGDVAHMRFFGDSGVDPFYSKLSTKWVHADYAAYFSDQDAYMFEFTGSPKLSSTSRADLEIFNPFVDKDGNETIDPATATIYQIVDGDVIDITDSFEYKETESGDMAFVTRTRFLGSYIICEKPIEEAVGDADIDDLMPDDMETPDDVTPDAGNNGGKAPANTGRYL